MMINQIAPKFKPKLMNVKISILNYQSFINQFKYGGSWYFHSKHLAYLKDGGVASEMVSQKPIDFSVMKNREATKKAFWER